jgi:hypothetical protein
MPPRAVPRLVKGRAGTGLVFPRVRAWIKAASPAPKRLIARDTNALGDRAHTDVAVEHLPGFLRSVGRSAAGKNGHGPMIPPFGTEWKPLGIVADWRGRHSGGAGLAHRDTP